jgi:hypothetical protein
VKTRRRVPEQSGDPGRGGSGYSGAGTRTFRTMKAVVSEWPLVSDFAWARASRRLACESSHPLGYGLLDPQSCCLPCCSPAWSSSGKDSTSASPRTSRVPMPRGMVERREADGRTAPGRCLRMFSATVFAA